MKLNFTDNKNKYKIILKKRIYIFLIFSLFFTKITFGQSYNSYFQQFEMRYNYGVSIPHHSYMNFIIKKHIMFGEFNYSIKTDGSRTFQKIWRCPEYGAGILFGNLGNNEILGYATSMYGFIGIPIIETEHLIFKYRLCTGLAYISEKYNNRSNNLNIIIGSHLNIHVQISLLADIKPFNFPLYLVTGIVFNHYSVGAIKLPNLGINAVSLTAGLKYLYSQYPYSLMNGRAPNMYNKELEISAFYSAAIKQNTSYSKYYFVNTINGDFGLRVSLKRTLGIGTRLVFDPSLKMWLEEEEKYQNTSQLFRLGIHAFQEVYFLDDFSCLAQIGAYVYNRYSTGIGSWIYANIGLRYTFPNNMFVNILLKTQSLKADCVEFSVGYRFMRYKFLK